MTHSFEEHLAESGHEPNTASAQILPFHRPPTDLQRAIQARAQETLELERERERERSRPAPARWTIMCVLALVPVAVVVAGVDAFVRAFHHINEKYSNMPIPEQTESVPTEISVQEPGVVMLQPLPDENGASKATDGG